MCITACPDKITGHQITLLRKDVSEQRIGGNVELNAQEIIGTALVELAGKFAVSHIKLKQRVTGRQSHLINLGGIPGRNNVSPGVRLLLDLVQHVGDLVDGVS